MKTPFRELKLKSKQALLGKYGITTGAFFVLYGLSFVFMMMMQILLIVGGGISIIATEGYPDSGPLTNAYIIVVMVIMYLAMFLLMYMIIPGLVRLYLNIAKKEQCRVSDVFFAFRNHPGKFVGISLLLFLGTMILMIPYLILIYAATVADSYYIGWALAYLLFLEVIFIFCMLTYGFFYIILVEDPSKGILEALKESHTLMKKNRGRLFLLGLSFLGWFIFSYATFFIGLLWLLPYISVTGVFFYLDLKQKAEPTEEIPPQWTQQLENIQEDSRF